MNLQAPTGMTVVTTSEPAAAVAALNGRVRNRNGQRLVVDGGSPADVNELLVKAGVPVDELGPERLSLEDVILARTEPGSDRVP